MKWFAFAGAALFVACGAPPLHYGAHNIEDYGVRPPIGASTRGQFASVVSLHHDGETSSGFRVHFAPAGVRVPKEATIRCPGADESGARVDVFPLDEEREYRVDLSCYVQAGESVEVVFDPVCLSDRCEGLVLSISSEALQGELWPDPAGPTHALLTENQNRRARGELPWPVPVCFERPTSSARGRATASRLAPLDPLVSNSRAEITWRVESECVSAPHASRTTTSCEPHGQPMLGVHPVPCRP